jgi:polysaccharide deacetylase 2 family uncharacterized protein YibQ
VATDDLSAPLGVGRPKRTRSALPPIVPRAIAGVLALCLAVFVLWALLANDPFGGEPVAIVPIERGTSGQPAKTAEAPPAAKTATAPQPTADASQAPAKPPGRTVTIIDGMSGKRQDVTIGESATPAPTSTIADPRLSETTPDGIIPKVGADGARAAEVYARPANAPAGQPRIAILLTGLGIGASGTSEALAKLPAAVTLAFSPYGRDLERLVAKARGTEREIVLQVPMEPADYPDNDPGPQTLLTSLSAEQNLDRLHWCMSRFGGYVGIVNTMGARFTAAEQSLGPVLRDAGARGLIYVDDGSSARSLASQIAGGANMPFAKVNMALDAVPTPGEIDGALSRLEALARERGVAIGVASALPASIDRITHWAKALQGRGISLVPISAVASKPKSS